MTHSTLLTIAVLAALMLALLADRLRWRRKPQAELQGMAEGVDWRKWKPAILELRRRGQDITRYIPQLLRFLVSESNLERSAAKITLCTVFPNMDVQLRGYSPSDGVSISRMKLKEIFAEYRVE